MKTKKEIDRDYYLSHKEEVKRRNAAYQKNNPESHRKASLKYEKKYKYKVKKTIIRNNEEGLTDLYPCY